MDAVNCPATRRKTLHCGINQGINLDSIESGIAGIQFKIGLHHEDRLDTLFVYLNCRPDVFDIGIVNRHGVYSCIPLTLSPELGRRDLPSSQVSQRSKSRRTKNRSEAERGAFKVAPSKRPRALRFAAYARLPFGSLS